MNDTSSQSDTTFNNIKFADDINLNKRGMQELLDCVYRDSGLDINADKTKSAGGERRT